MLMAPLLRRSWSPRGITPIISQRTRSHQKVSMIAALCISPFRDRLYLYFRLHPNKNINSTLVVDFLKNLAKQLNAPVVLVWDRFLAHRAKKVMRFITHTTVWYQFFLPPYAPELNPVENVWSYLKMNPLANFAPTDLEILNKTTRHHALSVQRKQHLLRSFMSHSPLSLRLK